MNDMSPTFEPREFKASKLPVQSLNVTKIPGAKPLLQLDFVTSEGSHIVQLDATDWQRRFDSVTQLQYARNEVNFTGTLRDESEINARIKEGSLKWSAEAAEKLQTVLASYGVTCTPEAALDLFHHLRQNTAPRVTKLWSPEYTATKANPTTGQFSSTDRLTKVTISPPNEGPDTILLNQAPTDGGHLRLNAFLGPYTLHITIDNSLIRLTFSNEQDNKLRHSATLPRQSAERDMSHYVRETLRTYEEAIKQVGGPVGAIDQANAAMTKERDAICTRLRDKLGTQGVHVSEAATHRIFETLASQDRAAVTQR